MSHRPPDCICGHRDAAHELTFEAACTECDCKTLTPVDE